MSGTPHLWACILGQPVGHSLSPALHDAAFAALGLDAHYEAREVAPADLAEAVEALRAETCLGANVTAPHKQAVIPLLDGLIGEARLLGAVNTIVNREGRLLGDNTDAPGLARWLTGVDPAIAGKSTLVLGAGGAGRATVVALARAGARSVRLLNRTPSKAEAVVAELARHVPGTRLSAGALAEAAAEAAAPAYVVVNATSLGHEGATPEVHPSWYAAGGLAVELAYNPPVTPFMRAAARAGVRTENGLGMLVHQAVLAFALWTGQTPSAALYEAAARRALAERGGPATPSDAHTEGHTPPPHQSPQGATSA